MTKRLYAHLILAFAVFIASCSTQPIGVTNCYTYGGSYDWLTSQGNELNMITGTYNIAGNPQSSGQELIVNWEEPMFVHVIGVKVVFGRINTDALTEPALDISVAANVFGTPVTGVLRMDSEEWNKELELRLNINESDVLVSGNSVNATVQIDDFDLTTNNEIEIYSVTVFFDEPQGFPRNDCDPNQPTPDPDQTEISPSETPSPDVTITPTPTATSSAICWKYEYDFANGATNAGWTVSAGTFQSGVGFTTVLSSPTSFLRERRLTVNLPNSANNPNIKEVRAFYVSDPKQGATNIRMAYGASFASNLLASAPPASSELQWTGSMNMNFWYFDGTAMYSNQNPAVDYGGSLTLTKVYFIGTGANTPNWLGGTLTTQACDALTPTPTQTASVTPLPPTGTPPPTSVPPTATRTPIPTFPIPTATRTLIPTFTPRTPTATRTATSLPPTSTAIPPTNTPAPTNTPPPTQTPLPLPTALPTNTLDPSITPTIGGTATPNGTPIPGYDWTPYPGTPSVGTLVGTPVGTPIAFSTPSNNDIGEYLEQIDGALNEAVEAVNQLPGSIGGIVPDLTNIGVFSGYIKWVSSGFALQELVGRKLFPILQHGFYLLLVVFFIIAIPVIIRFVVFLFRFVTWLVKQIARLILFFLPI